MAPQRELTNTEKAALTLLTLGQDITSQVLKILTEPEVKRISRAFMTVNQVPREVQFQIAKEFRVMIKSGETLLVDGREFAKGAIEGAFGEVAGQGMLDFISGTKKEPISQIVKEIPEKILNGFIQTEHPQTVAFLLTRMNPDQASGVLQGLPEDVQTDIILRIAHLNNVSTEVIDEVREVLRSQLRGSGLADGEEVIGPKSAADILNFVDRTNEERIIAEVEEMFPDIAEQIRNLMFTFEDIKKIDDRGIQTVLKEVPRDQLVLGLKTVSPELREQLFRNVSQRAAQMIQEDLEAMGPVKLKDVEKAQQGIVDIVRRLEAEGKIVVGGGTEDAMI